MSRINKIGVGTKIFEVAKGTSKSNATFAQAKWHEELAEKRQLVLKKHTDRKGFGQKASGK